MILFRVKCLSFFIPWTSLSQITCFKGASPVLINVCKLVEKCRRITPFPLREIRLKKVGMLWGRASINTCNLCACLSQKYTHGAL